MQTSGWQQALGDGFRWSEPLVLHVMGRGIQLSNYAEPRIRLLIDEVWREVPTDGPVTQLAVRRFIAVARQFTSRSARKTLLWSWQSIAGRWRSH